MTAKRSTTTVQNLIDNISRAKSVLEGISDPEVSREFLNKILNGFDKEFDFVNREANRLWAYRILAVLLAFVLGSGSLAIAFYSVEKSGTISVGTGLIVSSTLALASAFFWGFRPQKELDGSSTAFSHVFPKLSATSKPDQERPDAEVQS